MSLEKRLGLLANLAIVLIVICSLRIVYWQLVRGDQLLPIWLRPLSTLAGEAQVSFPDLNDLPQPVFQRTIAFLSQVSRGSIYDRSDVLLAADRVDEQGNRSRTYPVASAAPVIGYVSGYNTGLSGLERNYDRTLLGMDRLDTPLGELIHQPVVGSDLVLTLDASLQTLADQALQKKAGAVIVMDAKTGAVLAMASAPHYDPNRVLEPGYLAGLETACGDTPACKAPLLNRATQALYPPGSTFKTITLIAGLDTGQLKSTDIFDFGQPLNGPSGPYYVYNVNGGGSIPDYNHTQARLDLGQSYAFSANAAFAKIGDEMSPATLEEYGQRFGFSTEGGAAPFDLDTSPSQLAQNVGDLSTNNMLRASTAIGQGELLTTPLNIGRMALAVVNDGSLPTPYLVEQVKDPSGRVIHARPGHSVLRGLMSPETAKTVRQMMIGVVSHGTAANAAVPGLAVGGKTGTAQLGGTANPHAWFVGFAVGKERSVVVVVVIENGGEGSATAVPIFVQMVKAAVK